MTTQHTPEERRGAIGLSVTDDHMEAWVQVQDGFEPSGEDYREALHAAGIIEGIDEDALAGAEANPPVYEGVVLARGRLPVAGRQAEVEFLFATLKSPFVAPDDLDAPLAIDFRESKVLQHVGAGDVLARKRPASVGVSGATVFGAELPASGGGDTVFLASTNCTYSDDRTAILAKISGVPILEKGNKVSVQAVLQAKNVDYSSGNLHHIGSVKIDGDVLPGFRIEATGNIDVGGTVEGASLLAGGMVLIRGGIRNRATVEAVGDVFVKFVDSESSVKSQSSIHVALDCIQSRLDASECIVVGGQISGGHAKSGLLIEARGVGSMREVATRVEILRVVGDAALVQAREELARLEAAATQPMRSQGSAGPSVVPGGRTSVAAGGARPSMVAPPRLIAPPAMRPVGTSLLPRPNMPAIMPRPPTGLGAPLRLPKPPPPGASLLPRAGVLLAKPTVTASDTPGATKPESLGARLGLPSVASAPQTASQMRRAVQEQVRHEWDVLASRRVVDYLVTELANTNTTRGRVVVRGNVHAGTTVAIHHMVQEVHSPVQGRVYFAGEGYVKEAIVAMAHLGT